MMTYERAKFVLDSVRHHDWIKDPELVNHENSCDVSILIPCYNCEQYIESCITSICEQNIRYSYEVIVVNDGSTDNTLAILSRLSNRYKSIVLINQQNMGLARARNTLLNNAHGEYIFFVDADDLVPDGAINILLDTASAKLTDMVVGPYQEIPRNNIVRRRMSNRYSVPGHAWGKLIKRSLFNQVRFIPDYIFEDTLLHFVIFPMLTDICFIDDVVYLYRINKNGLNLSSQKNYSGLDSVLILEPMLQLRKRLSIEPDYDFTRFFINQLGPMTYRRIRHYPREIQKASFVFCSSLYKEYFKHNKGNSALSDFVYRQGFFNIYIANCVILIVAEKIKHLIENLM